jgi:predicted small secreted protein
MKDRLLAFLSQNGTSLSMVILLVTALLLLSGCGTVAGLGTDITRSANWTQEKMSKSK